MRRLLLASVGMVALAAVPAQADVITLDPDFYAAGTDLSHVGPGVTLAVISGTADNNLLLSAVYARRNPLCSSDPFACDAFTGSQGFASEPGAEGTLFGQFGAYAYRCFMHAYAGYEGPNACRDAMPGLLIAFDGAADFVEIAGAWNSDYTRMYAFDEDFRLLGDSGLGLILPRQGLYSESIATLTSPTGSIKYVVAGSVGGSVALDALRYRAVPEPATVALLALGCAGLLRARRR